MQFDNQGWLSEAIEFDYTHRSESRQGYKIKYVVIHATAGGSSAEQIAIGFRDGERVASAHLIIDQQGKIAQGIPLSLAAWANGVLGANRKPFIPSNINPNWYTVSIEFVKSSPDNSNALTPIQFQIGCEVVRCICDAYGIPKHPGDANGGILAHWDISATACPGPIPWQELWNYLAGNQSQEEVPMVIDLSTPGVSNFFKGKDPIWECTAPGISNGKLIGHAILKFYREFGGNGLCGLTHLGLPQTNELQTGKPGVVMQRFERAVVAWDPNHVLDRAPGSGPAYLMHITNGLGQDPRIADLQAKLLQANAENADLKEQLEAGNVITQEIKDDILVLEGNVTKLKEDAGI